MNFGLKSFVLCACLCISSVLVAAQGATCTGDGEASAQGAAIGCVTGEGVEIKGTASSGSQAPDTVALPPDQRPAIPPVVTYANGKLTIVAKNSTLSDILLAVGDKTGAAIDVPEGVTERVVTQLGPGPARDVVAALLNGSHFNYVMVGTETNPNAVAHVILTAKTESKEGTTPNTVARAGFQPRTAMQQAVMRPYQEMLQQQQAQQVATPDFSQQATVEQPAPSVGRDEAGQANSTPVANSAAPSSGNTETASVEPAPVSGAAPNNTGAAGERSPQQVLQDLYETRRQMIQSQRQPPPPQQ